MNNLAWKKAIIVKSGFISRHRISSKNLRENYRPVGEAKIEGKWRIVYGRRNREIIPKTKFKLRQLKAIREKPITGMLTKEEIEHPKVEVTGLVSVSYESKKNSSFHAEMIFEWYGPGSFNIETLLDGAVEVLITTLPEIERIPFELASVVTPDFNRRGVERSVPYDGQRLNEMDFEIFIPRVGGRVLQSGTARVEA